MKRSAFGVILTLALATTIGFAGEVSVNKWTRLPGSFPGGYNYSAIVYAADRGQLLHWGAVRHARDIKAGNDVRAFDASALKWDSDYSSDPKQTWGITGGGSGGATSYCGKGRMLASGRPYAAMIVNAVCYDTKRKQVVYSMPGLMAAYDPATKKWRDMKATTELHGKKLPGGPPVYGPGMCYDPLNDEIVMFPQFGAQSSDMRAATGRISAHLGTIRYSFKTNTWKRVASELGTPETKKARKAVIDLLARISRALDEIWAAKRKQDKSALTAAGKKLNDCSAECGKLKLGAKVATALKAAAAGACANPAAALKSGSEAVWALEGLLREQLAVEPTVRSVAPMVYDAKNKCIVMFGGDSGRIRTDLATRAEHIAGDRRLNDTWLYDCKTRQWKNVSKPQRPPRQQAPNLVYDPDSGLSLLVTLTGNRWNKRIPRKITLWSFDAAKRQWALRTEQDWDGEITDWYSAGLDAKKKLLVICQTSKADQVSWAMKLNVKSMASKPAPALKILPPETPTAIPPDDPAWTAKLKSLPANKWIGAKPSREASRRDWGNIACDPVRGWLVFFGGGHSTYQGTDVVIYVLGANKWVHQAGGHNDSVPRVGWGGYHMGARGSTNAGHMRNQYVAIDGRMYVNSGYGSQLKPRTYGSSLRIFTETEIVSLPDKPYAWFYDVDRGGVWRQLSTEIEGELPKPSRGRRPGLPMVVDARGKVYSIRLTGQRYSNVTNGAFFTGYDIYKRKTMLRPIPKPWPARPPESRPFCMLPDKNQIFFQDCDPKKKLFRTWVYDIKTNRFIDLKAANQPQGTACGTVYLEDQNAVLVALNTGGRKFEQWVYSFKRNKWAPLPFAIDSGSSKYFFKAPYTQMDYVAKYNVVINYNGRTSVMRVDLGKINFK
jgi:hypothetical protein